MVEERVKRRLAAILAADVVGYSRLMEQNEKVALATLKVRRKEILEPLIARYRGRTFKVTGDGVLVEFGSTVDAVECAIEIQREMAAAIDASPAGPPIILRIGINLGDVILEEDDLFGDGVNIAARLEALAEPGGILISGSAYEQVRNKVETGFDDLGVQSLKNIQEGVRAYRVAGTARITGMTTVASGKPSIAVLPFNNMSSDPEQQYFSDGITEDIITELSRFRQLHVLARNSSFRYRGPDVDVIRAGRELGVQYLVEGSVRRIGDRIRITAQLVDADSGHHLWAEHFDRKQDELFVVQDQVVRTIAGSLFGRLEAVGAERAKRKPPASLAAYDCVLQGNALAVHDSTTREQARRLFEKAVALDPGYARAYAVLAYNFVGQWYDDMSGSDGALDRAFELAKQAVVLDANDSASQSALGWVHLSRGSFDLAQHHYMKAVELNPNNPVLLSHLADLYTSLGKPDQALQCFKEVRLIDPFYDPSWYWPLVGLAHFGANRHDEAIAALLRSPNMPGWVHAYLAASYALNGKIERARHHALELVHLKPDFSLTRFADKQPYRQPEDQQRLVEGLRKAGLPE